MTDLPEVLAQKGACRTVEEPEIFFPTEYDDSHEAREICSACPVMELCLTYALPNEKWGLWGGASEKQRASMRAGITDGIRTCPDCNTKWVGRKAYGRHLREQHAPTLPHTCHCGRGFQTAKGLQCHKGKAHQVAA